jgi:hypothetical protein
MQTLVNAVKTVSSLPDVSLISKILSGYGQPVPSREEQTHRDGIEDNRHIKRRSRHR